MEIQIAGQLDMDTVFDWFFAMHKTGRAVEEIRVPKIHHGRVSQLFKNYVIHDGYTGYLYGARIVKDKSLKVSAVIIPA